MGKRYDYRRLYKYSVKDDFMTSSRGIIRRKSRVSIGIFSYISICVLIVLEILGSYLDVLLSTLLIMCLLTLIYWTRMGPITYLNIKMINSTKGKEKQSILEKFYVFHNKDGNYIKIQDKQMVKIKYHPFKWTTVKILFRDKYRNKYVFRINLKNIYVKICFSKVFNEEHFFRRINKLETTYKFNLDDLGSISNTTSFMIFLRDKYREIREVINS
jgi:hypothetical protein